MIRRVVPRVVLLWACRRSWAPDIPHCHIPTEVVVVRHTKPWQVELVYHTRDVGQVHCMVEHISMHAGEVAGMEDGTIVVVVRSNPNTNV